MTSDFFYKQPVRIWFGEGKFSQLENVMQELGCKKCVLVCGRHFAPEAKAKIIRKSLVVLAISLQLGAHSSILAQFMLTPVPSRSNATAHPFGTPLMSPFDVAVPRCAGWPAGLGSEASCFATITPRRQMRCRPSSGCSLRVTSSERARSTQ